jgi:hypothetical protein
MNYGGPARRCRNALIGGLLLALIPVSNAASGEWENIRDSYDNALRANEKRIKEIEAKERGVTDQEQRADKITRDKIASTRSSLKSGGSGRGKSLAEAADKASGDASVRTDLYRDQGEYLDVVTRDWGAEGAERKKHREAMATVQKNFERASANLTKAAKAAGGVESSDVVEKAARIEAAVTEAGDRLRARWQLEQAARERETKQREREAAERARGTR